MGSAVASLLLVAFPSPPHSRRGAGEAGGVVVYHRVGPPRRFAPPLLVQGGDRKLMNCSHLFTLSAPRPSLRACRAMVASMASHGAKAPAFSARPNTASA